MAKLTIEQVMNNFGHDLMHCSESETEQLLKEWQQALTSRGFSTGKAYTLIFQWLNTLSLIMESCETPNEAITTTTRVTLESL